MASQFPGSRPPAPTGGMVGRIKNILLQPNAEWDRIDAESSPAKSVFIGWAVPLAAITPVCGFIGMRLFGVGFGEFRFKPPLAASLVQAVLSYVAALAAVAILAFVIDALAPSFGAAKNKDQALKVAAYSYTASFVGGVFDLYPPLAVIALLFALYSFYLLWLGLPKLMKPAADKKIGYFAVTILIAIVVYIILGAIINAIAHPLMAGGGAAAAYQPV